MRVLIVDPDSRTPCPSDRIGEIWVAGPSIGQGYWNQAEESEHTFRAEIADGEGPFLRTGDLGFLADGELFITGRIKDLIIIDGSNHYPQDIERTVENSHPALRINGCAAFPVDTGGREQLAIAAEIAPRHLPRRRRPGAAPGPGLESAVTAIRKAVAEHHNLRVRHVALLRAGAMPKTSSGKIRRRDCRAAFLAETLDLVETEA